MSWGYRARRNNIILKGYRSLQRYRSQGYKVIAIVGFGGSGKSTFGNLYCGYTDRAPFRVEHGQDEGTLETTGYANHTTRIYWLDTRVGHSDV